MARLAWVLVGLTLAGCQVAGPPTPSLSTSPTASPTATPSPTRSTEPSSDLGCQTKRGIINMPTPTIQNLSQRATAVVVGYFVGYGEGHWNTPDGKAPDLATFRQGRAEIRTPIVVAQPEVLRGNESAAQHLVLAHEGRIGCVRFSGYVTPNFAVGARYVLFLFATYDSIGVLDDDLAVLIVWPVDQAGMVQTAHEGEVPLAELEELIRPSPAPASP